MKSVQQLLNTSNSFVSGLELLKTSSKKQQLLFSQIEQYEIFSILQAFTPCLVGTIPLQIDVIDSDVDIVCFWQDSKAFSSIINSFNQFKDFSIKTKEFNGVHTFVCRFRIEPFEYEIFGQNCPVQHQFAYKHFLIEYLLLSSEPIQFRESVMILRKSGMKTEPAFASVLGLSGNPFTALVEYGISRFNLEF